MSLKANFDIYKQCPQVYIYIITVITSVLVTVKYSKCKALTSISSIISGILGVILLMGINYCDWYFQWITYIFSSFSLLTILINVILLSDDYSYMFDTDTKRI